MISWKFYIFNMTNPIVCLCTVSLWYIYHLFTETEGNSVFCGPETAVVARGEAEGNNGGRGATKHTAFPRSQ
jgi:hypothetical protein